MIDKTEYFTFTLLYRDEDEKVILITHGETPAKSEDEADTVLTSENKDEASTVDAIIDKLFKDCEPGCEESVSASLQEFEDRYDLSLEELEEEVGEDLDNDFEKDEEEEHREKVLGKEEEEELEKQEGTEDGDEGDSEELEGTSIIKSLLTDPMQGIAIVSISDLTDPYSALGSIPTKARHTNPIDYLEEELPENEYSYDPLKISIISNKEEDKDEEELEENFARGIAESAKRFLSEVRLLCANLRRDWLTVAEVTSAFNASSITKPEVKTQVLNFLIRVYSDTSRIKLFRGPIKPAIHGRMEIPGDIYVVIPGVQRNQKVSELPEGSTEETTDSGMSNIISILSGTGSL